MSRIMLFANPYDINAQGFYFSTYAELLKKLHAHPTVEEYELEFVDGRESAMTLFDAMKPSLENVKQFFDTLLAFGNDDEKLALICYALENRICNTLADAEDFSKNASTFEGTIEEYAAEHFDSIVNSQKIPEIFVCYFDHEAFSRDLKLEGHMSEYRFCDKTFVVFDT